MRMNPQAGATAAELLEQLEEGELADLIYAYGEERLSRRIARRIKQHLQEQGPFRGTAELAYAIAGCYPPKARHGRIHPATRSFQALRIAVNDELGVLDRLLASAPDWLVSGGLFGVISFHSLEDRRVKTAFVSDAAAGHPQTGNGHGGGATLQPPQPFREVAPGAAAIAPAQALRMPVWSWLPNSWR
jgi:16S rRNA (cytosine1402-N4)-methyltransferase